MIDLTKPVQILSAWNKQALKELSSLHPLYADLLNDGGPILGRARGAQEVFMASVLLEALRAGAAQATVVIPPLRQSLRRAEKLELASEVGGAIGGSTLLAMLASLDGAVGGKMAIASLTLICSVLAIIARRMRTTLVGQSGSEQYVKLVTAIAEATVLVIYLETWLQFEKAPPLDDAIVKRAESCVAEFAKLLAHR
jgi:hypothetical protein